MVDSGRPADRLPCAVAKLMVPASSSLASKSCRLRIAGSGAPASVSRLMVSGMVLSIIAYSAKAWSSSAMSIVYMSASSDWVYRKPLTSQDGNKQTLSSMRLRKNVLRTSCPPCSPAAVAGLGMVLPVIVMVQAAVVYYIALLAEKQQFFYSS